MTSTKKGYGALIPVDGAELDDLQKRFHLLEGSRKAMKEDSVQKICMQQQKIQKLKKQNDRLKEELVVETRQAKSTTSSNQSNFLSDQLSKLEHQGKIYQRKIQQEKARIEELDAKIVEMEAAILVERKKIGKLKASRDNNAQIQKKIKMLENRLDKALMKFNEALGHNKQLRETIDNLRKERVVFDGIYRKLEVELKEKKKKMASIIEVSNAAYLRRDEAQMQMMELKAQADQEHAVFQKEWQGLSNLIQKDRELKAFLKQSGTNNIPSGAEKKKNLKKPAENSSEIGKLRRKLNSGVAQIVKDKQSIKRCRKSVTSYEEALKKIQRETGISDVNELVETFIKAEEKNFALFNHVNDLMQQIEVSESELQRTKDKIRKLKKDKSLDMSSPSDALDAKRRKILAELHTKLEKVKKNSVKVQERHSTVEGVLNKLKEQVGELVSELKIDEGQTVVITNNNIMHYLGLLEMKAIEISGKSKESREEEKLFDVFNNNDCEDVSIVPPTTIDQHDSDEAITHDEDEQ